MVLSLIQLTLGVLRTRREVARRAGQWYILVARLENTIAPGRRASDLRALLITPSVSHFPHDSIHIVLFASYINYI